MSSIVFSTGYVGGEKKEYNSNPGKKRLYNTLLFLLAALVIVEAAFQLYIAPGLTIDKIEVHCSGSFPISNSDILKLAGLEGSLYYFSANTDQIESRLMQHPLIRSVKLEKHFPSSMSIYINERIPLAMALVNSGGRTIPVAFDEEGVIFEIGKSVSNYQLPVVSGLKFVDLKLGLRLPGELTSYLAELKILKESNPLLFGQISEFKFINKHKNDYEVLLYPSGSGIKVRTGSGISDSLVKQIFVVLDIIEKNGLKSEMTELDFRSGQVVFRVKEG
ncbi:MAG: FtsQ-type POTRA domain-containing protein [Spirochaetia bacterium]|jgi:cell division protein FtsQ|nr:FtsQ-type POTRA domain-containing protein [Spirochaetia bacterium]